MGNMKLEMNKMTQHECIHEELINSHSLQITELETKSKYKEQSIMEIKEQLKELNTKIDALSVDVSKVINKSEKGVKSLEDKINIYEKFFATSKDEQDKRTRNIIAISAVIATIVGILISNLIKFI